MRVLVLSSLAYSLVNFRGDLLKAMLENGHEVIACAPRGEEIAVDWRLSGSVRVGPGATIKPYVVHTTFRVRDGLVVFQEDEFSIPGWQILLGVLLPGLPIPESAPPVEELRRRAGT